jgi:tRNA (guanine-N7-)-methyltransferase
MPVKNPDPFFEFIDKLDPKVNPYVELLKTHTANQSLPLTYGQDLKRFVGQWQEAVSLFYGNQKTGIKPNGEPTPKVRAQLLLEIGCHNGHTLTEIALSHSDWTVIGLDITFKRIVTTAQRLAKNSVQNAFCALANAQNLSHIFGPHEIDGLVIFFPDPWVKKARQTKNRLVNDHFISEIKKCLKQNGFVWFKSDQKIYFDQVVALMTTHGFGVQGQVPAALGRDYSSSFETRFHAQGLPTYGCVFQKLDA